ncbi:MAG: PHP domain-containing protein [Clostridia bacterium]|nr:PHP domain-containing protein [Clostridia bacterium]
MIDHDFHIHTNLSICANRNSTLGMYVDLAKEQNIKKIAITNHMWDHAVKGYEDIEFYFDQNFDWIKPMKEEIKNTDTKGVKVLFGAEAEYSFKAERPAVTPAVAEQMDILLIPISHTHLAMPREFYEPHSKHIDFMIKAFMDTVNSDVAKYTTAIAHPFMAVCCPYDRYALLDEITDDQFKRCFSAAAEKGIAMELNPLYIKDLPLEKVPDSPLIRMFRIAKDEGCLFTVGTDAHSSADMDYFKFAENYVKVLDLKDSDFHPITK